MLGVALGCIGLSYDDFCNLYAQEFAAINKAWYQQQEALQQGEWERTRILAAITIQPHVKKKLTPEKLLPLPWDRKKKRTAADAPQLTKEQQHQRFKDLLHRLGED